MNVEGNSTGSSQKDSGSAEPLNMWFFVNPLLEHRRMILLAPITVALFVGGYLLLSDRTWTAKAAFLPTASTPTSRSNVSLIAQQFGVDLSGAGDPGQTPQFYRDLLRSRSLLREIVASPYRIRNDTGVVHVSLVDLLSSREGVEDLPVERAITSLQRRISVSFDQATSVVTINVTTKWPEISQQIAARMLDRVNAFNIRRIRQQAEARREFTAQMVDSAQRLLRDAEDLLQTFVERNRVYTNDPRLSFEHDRLLREVVMRQSVYTSLVSSYEQARVDAVRDTPLITVVETPTVPALPDKRGTVLKTALAFSFTAWFAVVLAFLKEFVARSRERDPLDYQQFAKLRDESMRDVRRLLTRVKPGRRSVRQP